MKKLLFIGYNFSPELTGIGKYSGEMMQWLAEKGHDCTVLTSYPYYPYWKIQEPYRKNRFWFKKEVT
ncbi:MAG: colanic acid biosynthesis glycosyltransferase WcaI, partial [Maribacter dokdonensis]